MPWPSPARRARGTFNRLHSSTCSLPLCRSPCNTTEHSHRLPALQASCSKQLICKRVVLQLAPLSPGHLFGSQSSCAAFSSVEFLPTICAHVLDSIEGILRTRHRWHQITIPVPPVLRAARHPLLPVELILNLAWRPTDSSRHHVFNSCTCSIRGTLHSTASKRTSHATTSSVGPPGQLPPCFAHPDSHEHYVLSMLHVPQSSCRAHLGLLCIRQIP